MGGVIGHADKAMFVVNLPTTSKWQPSPRQSKWASFISVILRLEADDLIYRTILVKLVSTAQTGYFYSTTRPRLGEKLARMKYDPKGKFGRFDELPIEADCFAYGSIVKQHVLFTESKMK